MTQHFDNESVAYPFPAVCAKRLTANLLLFNTLGNRTANTTVFFDPVKRMLPAGASAFPKDEKVDGMQRSPWVSHMALSTTEYDAPLSRTFYLRDLRRLC